MGHTCLMQKLRWASETYLIQQLCKSANTFLICILLFIIFLFLNLNMLLKFSTCSRDVFEEFNDNVFPKTIELKKDLFD